MEQNKKLLQPSSNARYFALIPLVIIGGAVIAFLLGFRTEGRKPVETVWRTQTVAEYQFTASMPGMVAIAPQTWDFAGASATGQSYISSGYTADFRATTFRRPDSDPRPYETVAKDLGLPGDNATALPGGFTAFTHDVTEGNQRTIVRMMFRDRFLYQLVVTGPVKTFPEKEAQRFLSSFKPTGA